MAHSQHFNTTTLEDRYVNIHGINTRYWQAGTTGANVLLLHGIGCSVLEWEPNIAMLSAGYRVFAVDLLGHGLTDKPANETYSIRRHAQFVLDFMTAIGIEHTHFAGNSLGGRLALECAIIAPARVDSIVLVDPAGIDQHGTLLEFRLATLPLLGEIITWPNRLGTRMLWNKAFANPSSFVTEELVTTKVRLTRQPGAQAAFLKTLRNFMNVGGFQSELVTELQASLPDIKIPVLVIWGRDDQLVSSTHAEVLRRLLPNVQIQLWDSCGHAPQIECSEQFNKTVLKFWDRLEANNG